MGNLASIKVKTLRFSSLWSLSDTPSPSVSCNSGWSWTPYEVEDNLEFETVPSLHPSTGSAGLCTVLGAGQALGPVDKHCRDSYIPALILAGWCWGLAQALCRTGKHSGDGYTLSSSPCLSHLLRMLSSSLRLMVSHSRPRSYCFVCVLTREKKKKTLRGFLSSNYQSPVTPLPPGSE